MTNTYQVGETVRINASITSTATGNAADPTTTTVKIVDPGATVKVDDTAMTKSATGEYYYDYDLPATGNLGEWRYNVIATGSTGRVTIKRSTFIVEKEV